MSGTETKTRAEQAIDSGMLVCSMLHICRAAAEFASDNDGYPIAKHIPAYLAHVLSHAEGLAGEAFGTLESLVRSQGGAE